MRLSKICMMKKQKNNYYDNISFDLVELNKIFFPSRPKKNFFFKFIARYFIGFLIYTNLYSKFIDSGFIRFWFNDFKIFWNKYLNGRPLYFNDFPFLLGLYRQKFQDISIEDESIEEEFYEAWQSQNSIYLLFGNVRKYSYRPLHSYYLEKYISDGDKILEYGSGIAPFSYSLVNFSLKKNLDITIADILQINFIYAKYILSGHCNYKLLQSRKHNLANEYYDVIILEAVLEHIPDPMETIKSITNSLKKNGILIFDYIISSEKGHDTSAAAEYRNDVLNFIDKNFSIIKGKINIETSMNTTIAKKK